MINRQRARLIGLVVLMVVGGYLYYQFASPRVFEVKGRVAGFGTDRTTLIVSHEDIPGYMKAMTMPFTVRDTSELTSLHTGDPVGFTLHVTSKDAWITNIRPVPDSLIHVDGNDKTFEDVAAKGDGKQVQAGDLVPEVTLVNQDGKKVNTSDFRNKVLVITFFYTSCPLPNYCPLMSGNFREAENTLVEAYGQEVHLLSISFDTQKDTPEVLKKYGQRYRAQFGYWSFASGTDEEIGKLTSAFGVFYQPQKGTFTHNLRTVVIGKDGRIRKIFPGNQWTPEDLVREVAAVVK